jgi:transcriptional regulator with XRE-family HTH domain
MKKNEELSKFLAERRKLLGKSQTEISKAIGMSYPNLYHVMEKLGRIPRDKVRRTKLAEELGVSLETILEKAIPPAREEPNLFSIIRALVQSDCQVVFWADIEYLVELQEDFKTPITPELVREIMKLRHPQAQT